MKLARGGGNPAADARPRAFLWARGDLGRPARGGGAGGAESKGLEVPPGWPERGTLASPTTCASDAHADPPGAGGVGGAAWGGGGGGVSVWEPACVCVRGSRVMDAGRPRGQAGADGLRRGPRRLGKPRRTRLRADSLLRSAPQCREGASAAGRSPGSRKDGASFKAPGQGPVGRDPIVSSLVGPLPCILADSARKLVQFNSCP